MNRQERWAFRGGSVFVVHAAMTGRPHCVCRGFELAATAFRGQGQIQPMSHASVDGGFQLIFDDFLRARVETDPEIW
jgi:hypothetical protein